jgi:5'-methylthioadenosine phosphorylase
MKIGLISGHEMPDLVENPEKITVETPYGPVPVLVAMRGNHEIFFINRHGKHANLPPHAIAYRANIHVFSSSHVDCIFSMGTVGSLTTSIQPGDIVLPHDFIDMTKSRPVSFFDDARVHVDMSTPFCPALRELMITTSKKHKQMNVHEKGVYLTTEGPRLETKAEINLFAPHADVVGMTLVPEVVLAREKGICYASLCLVCNMAAGLQRVLSAEDISANIKQQRPLVISLLTSCIDTIDQKKQCSCQQDLTKATL